jgi:hypothetical protein
MKMKHLLTGLAVLFGGTAANAVEATQDDPATTSTLTREEVRAEVMRAQREGLLLSGGEHTVSVDTPVAATRTREEVRAEAVAAMRDAHFGSLYVGG